MNTANNSIIYSFPHQRCTQKTTFSMLCCEIFEWNKKRFGISSMFWLFRRPVPFTLCVFFPSRSLFPCLFHRICIECTTEKYIFQLCFSFMKCECVEIIFQLYFTVTSLSARALLYSHMEVVLKIAWSTVRFIHKAIRSQWKESSTSKIERYACAMQKAYHSKAFGRKIPRKKFPFLSYWLWTHIKRTFFSLFLLLFTSETFSLSQFPCS